MTVYVDNSKTWKTYKGFNTQWSCLFGDDEAELLAFGENLQLTGIQLLKTPDNNPYILISQSNRKVAIKLGAKAVTEQEKNLWFTFRYSGQPQTMAEIKKRIRSVQRVSEGAVTTVARKYVTEVNNLLRGQIYTLIHGLHTKDVIVWIYRSNGRLVETYSIYIVDKNTLDVRVYDSGASFKFIVIG